MTKIDSDLTASELISRSMSGELSREELRELESYKSQMDAQQTEAVQAFESLTAWIERSAAQGKEDVSRDSDGLSELSKERLKRAIRSAQRDSWSAGNGWHDTASKVAETPTSYLSQDATESADIRQAVSRFTLLSKIGEGGLGTVWLARDERLRRNVAIKEMSPKAAASPRLWRRFQREAEITGHLEHPNVVPLYMSGVNPETKMPFYAMRFVGKQTLAEAIREFHAKVKAHVDEPIDLHRLLNVFLKVCQAIAFAHSRGVIHRDLKPENVVLDNFGQVIVLDWGLAKLDSDGELALRLSLAGDASNAHLSQTIDGDVVGTPLYMSPEQAAGDLDKLDARTDVYGLGAILFAILTGNAPHENSHRSVDGSLRVEEFLNCIAGREAPDPRAVNSDIPHDLAAICQRAMARERFARHATATDLAAEVERWIAGKHEKETRYDAMRLAGRDLKSRLCVQLRQLGTSTQFMVELPPIQELVDSFDGDSDEYAIWRERLSQILIALARSKPNVSGYSFSRLADDRVQEIVRVERSLHDFSHIRSVPQSRLRSGVANNFQRAVFEQYPGDGVMDFECTASGAVRVTCGVPVFDARSEEPFGLVVAEAEVGNLVRPELELMDTPQQVYLVDGSGHVMFTSSRDTSALKKMASEITSKWDEIQTTLVDGCEYMDPDREVYANRLVFPQRNNSIYILLTAN
ncbi:MAG: serine/threonine protein kinase [bacterium]|nr:serine/threonine protein kinase [bacterium]